MSQKQLYSINIYEEAVLLTDFTSKHSKTFVVEQEELMKLFKFDMSMTLKPFPGLIRMKKGLNGKTTYMVTFPRAKRKLIYSKSGKLIHVKMEMPNLLIKATVDNGFVWLKQLSAYPGRLKSSTPLYELALPNISGSTICIGSSRAQESGNIMRDIDKAFYDSPFNHHSHLVGKEQMPFLDYVAKYKYRMPFHTLNQIGTGKDVLEET